MIIGQWHRSKFPQCILLQHLKFPIMFYKTLLTWPRHPSMLAVFASKNKKVVEIRIEISHMEAVSTRVEFAISHVVYLWSGPRTVCKMGCSGFENKYSFVQSIHDLSYLKVCGLLTSLIRNNHSLHHGMVFQEGHAWLEHQILWSPALTVTKHHLTVVQVFRLS